MSDATKKVLDEAIEAHLTDEIGPAVMTGYVCQIAAIKPEDSEQFTHFLRVTADQPLHVTLGLAHYLTARITANVTNDEEDE